MPLWVTCDTIRNGHGKDAPLDSPEIRQVELNESINPAGIHLYYPKSGDQVFDAPLPATRESRPRLRLLDEAKGISGGFRDSRIDDGGCQIEKGEH